MADSNPIVDAQAAANSLRAKILGIQDSKTELVVIPEWDNVEIEFHSLTGSEKSEWLARIDFAANADTPSEKAKRLQLFVELAVYTAYVPNSNVKLFEPNDSAWLLNKSAKALSRLEDTVGVLNGFVKDSSEKSQENAKNS